MGVQSLFPAEMLFPFATHTQKKSVLLSSLFQTTKLPTMQVLASLRKLLLFLEKNFTAEARKK